MDKLKTYRHYIEQTLEKYANYKSSNKNRKSQLLFDEKHNNYQFNSIGWDNDIRILNCIINISIVNQKIWIQLDNTEGIVDEFTELGVPNKDIVLAFYPKRVRKYTDFAVE